jgi:hypothetical protein
MLRILTRIALIGAGLVLPVVLLVAYWYLTACLYAESKVPQLVTPAATGWLDVGMLIGLGAIVLLFEANAYSLHQFYKDRLSKAFLFRPADPLPAEPAALMDFKLSAIQPNNSPYHILNAALNVQGSKEANRRGRNADFFTFTRDFVGSDLTHFAPTANNPDTLGMEYFDRRLDLGSAMAISGAAISANMGSNTVRWLSPTLALLNIRLGYWLRNRATLPKNTVWCVGCVNSSTGFTGNSICYSKCSISSMRTRNLFISVTAVISRISASTSCSSAGAG